MKTVSVILCAGILAVMAWYSLTPAQQEALTDRLARQLRAVPAEPAAPSVPGIPAAPDKAVTLPTHGRPMAVTECTPRRTSSKQPDVPARQRVYRWVDADGRVHYGDRTEAPEAAVEDLTRRYGGGITSFPLVVHGGEHIPARVRDALDADLAFVRRMALSGLDTDALPSLPLTLRLLPDKRAYRDFQASDAPGLEHALGYFSSYRDEAVTFAMPAAVLRPVIRHEMTHAINRVLYANAPVWFDEGMATYVESATLLGQQREVQLAPRYRQWARQRSLGSLAAYFRLTPDAWYRRNPEAAYAYAAALVYFLNDSPSGRRFLRGFRRHLLAQYCQPVDTVAYIQQHYPGGLATLERGWQTWLARDKRPEPHRY